MAAEVSRARINDEGPGWGKKERSTPTARKSPSSGGAVGKNLQAGISEVYATVRRLKQNGYNVLPLLLQREESRVIIDTVAVDFAEAHPDACLISIHDCLVTTKEYVEEVKSTIVRGFAESLGFDVPVTVRRFGKSHVKHSTT